MTTSRAPSSARAHEAEKLGTQAISAREESTAIRTVEAVIQAFGQRDSLINNAGAGNYKNLVETSAEEYDELMNTNVRSTFLFTRHTVPIMLRQKQGTILTISSMAGIYRFHCRVDYLRKLSPLDVKPHIVGDNSAHV